MTNTSEHIHEQPVVLQSDADCVLTSDAFAEISQEFQQATARADYLELRIERLDAMHAYLRGMVVEHSFIDATCGGYVRARRGNGWHVAQFEGLGAPGILTAIREATDSKTPPGAAVAPAMPASHTDTGPDIMHARYRSTVEALRACSEQVLSAPRVKNVQIDFVELHRHRTFVNSEQVQVHERRQCRLNNIIPMIQSNDRIMNLWGNFCDAADSLMPFTVPPGLTAEVLGTYADPGVQLGQLSPGSYTVVLDTRTSGYLMHELLGHLMEADMTYDHPSFYEGQLKPGRAVAPDGLTVVDDPTMPGLAGSYGWDDEGVPGERVDLIRDGEIAGFMHTRDTARLFEVAPNGHGRSVRFDLPPFARMSNTVIRPVAGTADDIIADVRSGVYLRNCMFAKNDLRQFVLYPREAYRIENGRATEQLLPPIAYGEIFDTLSRIAAIGGDLTFTNVGCTKGYADAWIPVSTGGVHMVINDMRLGETFL